VFGRFFLACSFTSFLIILSACASQPFLPPTSTVQIVTPEVTPTSAPVPTATLASTTTPSPTPASVSVLPDPAGYTWVKVQSGLERPVELKSAGDGSGRLFILEQAGVIRVMSGASIIAQPFLDIRDRVGRGGNERGLLGIAFHPDFKTNGTLFINYTDRNGNTVISRFSVPEEGMSADPNSEQTILQIAQPYANHNGGRITFGPDGMLWIGMGDGGGQGDPNGNGQSLKTLLGKILRIDVDNNTPYAIPADNPYAAGGGAAEIWAYGLRNPWGLDFDPLTGDLFIADVGQDAWEEIDFIPADTLKPPLNFGWSLMEGSHPYNNTEQSLPGDYVSPVFEYDHTQGCSVTGGILYRGTKLPAFKGVYIFGDYCSGTVWGLIHPEGQGWISTRLFQVPEKITSFGTDEQGDIYLVTLPGDLYRLDAK
jgi:glucose/arabinose dehydrogenase